MSVPTPYNTAKKRLDDFRDTILQDLVGNRVSTGLSASFESMQKYGRVLRSISIVPYMIGEVHRKAVALKLKGLDIGTGKIRSVRMDSTISEVSYPQSAPFNVPQRDLPQVDSFVYTPISDLELLEKTNVQNLKSFFLMQVTSDTFADQAEAENAIYDYYELIPQYRVRATFNLVDPFLGFEAYKTIKGEFVYMFRELTYKNSYNNEFFGINVWIDAGIWGTTEFLRPVVLGVEVYMPVTPLDWCWINCLGQRIPSGRAGLFMEAIKRFASADDPQATVGMKGFHAVAWTSTYTEYNKTWENNFTITMAVNDKNMGYTDPPEGSYTKKAGEPLVKTAYPNGGYKFKEWLRDNVPYSNTNPHTGTYRKTCTYTAVFEPL